MRYNLTSRQLRFDFCSSIGLLHVAVLQSAFLAASLHWPQRVETSGYNVIVRYNLISRQLQFDFCSSIGLLRVTALQSAFVAASLYLQPRMTATWQLSGTI